MATEYSNVDDLYDDLMEIREWLANHEPSDGWLPHYPSAQISYGRWLELGEFVDQKRVVRGVQANRPCVRFNKLFGITLQQYHGSMGSATYAAGSHFFVDKPVPTGVMFDCIRELLQFADLSRINEPTMYHNDLRYLLVSFHDFIEAHKYRLEP